MKFSPLAWLLLVVAALCLSACAANGVTPQPFQPRTALPTQTQPTNLGTATPMAVASASPLPATVTAATLPPPTAVPPTLIPPTPTAIVPPRLIIPRLELDQPIVPVAIVDGTWDMTQLDEAIGWLTTTGEQPGDDLAMALAGHVNISLGNPGPFVDLERLEPYDHVIYRSGGLDYLYAVQGQETVKPEAVGALYVADGSRLLLVTCSNWSYFWSRYARRLIVTADLVRTEASP